MGALLILMVRWIIAGIFLRAGVVKLGDRAGFRAAVANYQLLPPTLVAPVAAVLPVAEIAGAVLLAAGILTAPAAIALGLLLAAFASAIALALAQGRSFDCGCSGTAAPSRIGWGHVALDLVLAAGAALVAAYGPIALSVWPGPFRVESVEGASRRHHADGDRRARCADDHAGDPPGSFRQGPDDLC